MKKLLIFLFSILISFNSYGEWTEVGTGASPVNDGDTFYIDIDTIKEHNGYVYWWDLNDRLKPTEYGIMSDKTYAQGDCGVNRFKYLSFISYKQPMGEGSGETFTPPNPEWRYPSPDSVGGIMLKYACEYVD